MNINYKNFYTLLFIAITILISSCETDDEAETIIGCTDSVAYNYNPDATEDDGNCCLIEGCTDSSAFNYNADACYDDGSCLDDYRDQYIGEWEFNSYTSVSHPYDPSSSELNWIREITYGNNDNTLLIPHGPILEGYEENCFCYEFEINSSGEINDDTYDANDFNYYFNGYITGDSLYYTGVGGSPFSSTSRTVYGKKLN